MKRATLLLAFLFPALVTIVPSHANEIKIGLITPLSGDVKTYGESVRNSFLIAVEEANARGGRRRRDEDHLRHPGRQERPHGGGERGEPPGEPVPG